MLILTVSLHQYILGKPYRISHIVQMYFDIVLEFEAMLDHGLM